MVLGRMPARSSPPRYAERFKARRDERPGDMLYRQVNTMRCRIRKPRYSQRSRRSEVRAATMRRGMMSRNSLISISRRDDTVILAETVIILPVRQLGRHFARRAETLLPVNKRAGILFTTIFIIRRRSPPNTGSVNAEAAFDCLRGCESFTETDEIGHDRHS